MDWCSTEMYIVHSLGLMYWDVQNTFSWTDVVLICTLYVLMDWCSTEMYIVHSHGPMYWDVQNTFSWTDEDVHCTFAWTDIVLRCTLYILMDWCSTEMLTSQLWRNILQQVVKTFPSQIYNHGKYNLGVLPKHFVKYQKITGQRNIWICSVKFTLYCRVNLIIMTNP